MPGRLLTKPTLHNKTFRILCEPNTRTESPQPLVLSLCPGIDLLGVAFEIAGYTVVRGPDPILGQPGLETFHVPAGRFDGIITGDPCQPHSAARNGRQTPPSSPDLRTDVARVISEAQPTWWITENTDRAPTLEVANYQSESRILYAWNLGVDQRRPRQFTIGATDLPTIMWPAGEKTNDPLPTATARGLFTSSAIGKTGTWKDHSRRETPWKLLLEQFGLPDDWDIIPMTREGVRTALGNAVPIPVGLALAATIARAFGGPPQADISLDSWWQRPKTRRDRHSARRRT